jgi:hypothetical protein
MSLKEFRWEGEDKIHLTLDRDIDTGRVVGEVRHLPTHTEILENKIKFILKNLLFHLEYCDMHVVE